MCHRAPTSTPDQRCRSYNCVPLSSPVEEHDDKARRALGRLGCVRFSTLQQGAGAMTTTASSFATSNYFSLRSYKQDGKPVDTPVWFAPLDERWIVFTDGTSYKVKRIRRNPKIEVARCDVRGKVLGPWEAGQCRVVEGEPETIKRAYAALNAKYGLLMRLTTFFSTLAGRVGRRRILEIKLDGASVT
jgi:PPOX class probable F420-dependent enzyme